MRTSGAIVLFAMTALSMSVIACAGGYRSMLQKEREGEPCGAEEIGRYACRGDGRQILRCGANSQGTGVWSVAHGCEEGSYCHTNPMNNHEAHCRPAD